MDLFSYIKNALPILSVVQDFVQLRPLGNYWKGPCPFHNETDASFTISPDRQIFYCFGCHATGDVIAFTAKRENLSQIEAAKLLIEQHNLTIPPEILKGAQKVLQSADSEQRNRYYMVCEKFAQWCHNALKKSNTAMTYVTQRNLSEKTCSQFLIGYFPGGVQPVQQLINAMAQEGILLKDLVTFGVLQERQSYYSSPFEERIIFPIKDNLGRFCAFGGRIFKPGDERSKYYNSKESDWFIKGKTLYGLDAAKKQIQDSGKAFLVEGYMDCVTMVQHGFAATVATLGTACTQEHLKMLTRYAHTLYVLYDGDNAGQAAIVRMTELCWEVDLDLMVVTLPYKEDPASFLGRGGDLAMLLSQAFPIVNFFVATHLKDYRNKPMALKLAAIHKIFEVVLRLKDPLKRDLILQQTALAIDLPFQSVKDGLGYYARELSTRKNLGVPKKEELDDVATDPEETSVDISELEQKILYGIITNLSDFQFNLEAALLVYFSPVVRQILIKVFGYEGSCNRIRDEALLRTQLDDEERKLVDRILMSFETPISIAVFNQLINYFGKHHWKRIARDFRAQIQQAQKQGDNDLMQALVKKFSQLKQGFADKGLI